MEYVMQKRDNEIIAGGVGGHKAAA